MPSATPVAATLSLPVQKFGRTAGLISGTVDVINATIDICYQTRGPFHCVNMAKFAQRIMITPENFSAGGDSGSLIVTDDLNNDPVGLLFAGNPTHTIAIPIQPVLDAFGVTID